MEKVFFAVKRIGKEDNYRLDGKLGYVADNTLFIPQVSKKNVPYIKTFDIAKCARKDDGSTSGFVTELSEYEGRTIEHTYSIWFKKVED